VAIVNVPKALRDKLGEEGAEALVQLINLATDQTKADVLVLAGEKYERWLAEEGAKLGNRLAEEGARLDRRVAEEGARFDSRLTEEAARLDHRITEEVAKLDRKLAEEVGKLERRITEEAARLDRRITEEVAKLEGSIAGIRTQIADVRADLLRWMFVFWVGQIGALLGILFAFFRK
jgi:uncharacterized protein YdcH (DUF465 family)